MKKLMTQPEFIAHVLSTFSELWAKLPDAVKKDEYATSESAMVWTTARLKSEDEADLLSRRELAELLMNGRAPFNTIALATEYWEDQYEMVVHSGIEDVAEQIDMLDTAVERIHQMWNE